MTRIFSVLLLILLTSSTAMAAQAGKVTGLKGEASLRPRSNTSYAALKQGEVISEGNWIKTGPDGWVELTLSDNSRFTLANNTEMEVTSFLFSKKGREGSFNLAQGKLRASVVKLAGKQSSNLVVKSGTAVAGIKGTEFLMLTEGQANVFFGNEGTVSVSGDGKGTPKMLAQDTMTQNTRSLSPIDPLKVEKGTPVGDAREIFDRVTAATPPAAWTDSGNIANIIARWNINHGRYLADSGKYDDALHVFQISLDLTKIAEIRADSRLERGTVYARFLNNPEQALAEYLLVLEEYPRLPQAETALFNTAQTLSELGFADQAKIRFEQYLKEYPSGKHRENVETLLRNLAR